MSEQTDVRPRSFGGIVLSETWHVFPGLARDDPVLSTDVLRSIPDEIEVGGRRIKAQAVTASDGKLDLGPLHGGHARGKTGYVFASLEVREEGPAYLGFGADWFLQVWLDGKLILDTTDTGNLTYPISKSNLIVETRDLARGKHVLAARVISGTATAQFAMGPLDEMAMSRGPELTWKPHTMRIGDGKGGWTYRDAECRFLHAESARSDLKVFGVTQMDNGEIFLLASWKHSESAKEVPAAAFSKDRGDTWSDWRLIPGASGRPMMLAYLGNGSLTFQAAGMSSLQLGEHHVFQTGPLRFYSHDYGRTWGEQVPVQPATNGGPWLVEGNPLVEFSPDGTAKAIAETGTNWGPPGAAGKYPVDPAITSIRWSYDGGRTWKDEVTPETWFWNETWEGRAWKRGGDEGALVRANNGWLVAALRMNMHPRFFRTSNDNLDGMGTSISKDSGKTWSPLKVIHPAGRMHMHFVKMRNGDLVMIYIMRRDIAPDGIHYASYKRGCAALVSRDNGLTWDVSREYRLHEFDYATAHEGIGALACGHTCSTLLDDGSILTAYSHYISKGMILIRWKP